MNKIKIAIVGLGNCASSLIQGIHYYDGKNPEDAIGLMHWDIGGYSPSDIEVVAAFDVDVPLSSFTRSGVWGAIERSRLPRNAGEGFFAACVL